MSIKRSRLRKIIRDERMASFLRRHNIGKKKTLNECFAEDRHSYGYEWTEEELEQYTNDAGLSFQIKHIK